MNGFEETFLLGNDEINGICESSNINTSVAKEGNGLSFEGNVVMPTQVLQETILSM